MSEGARERMSSLSDDHREDSLDGESIRVAVRVRPFNAREAARGCKCCVEMSGNKTTLVGASDRSGDGRRDFTFDHCYWSHDRSDPEFASQEKVFSDLGRFALNNAFSGYNVCLFAYGQTGAGKSYSMVGGPDDKGIVPRVAHELFEYIDSKKDDHIAFEVVTSMIEIYKEKISDLLADAKKSKSEELKVREHPKTGPYVAGLTAFTANSFKEIERFLEMGNRNKSVASTHMNDVSSRAHTIFSIKFCQTQLEHLGCESGLARETKKVSHINLVDLAGSERQTSKQLSSSEQMRFKEGCVCACACVRLCLCGPVRLLLRTRRGCGRVSTRAPRACVRAVRLRHVTRATACLCRVSGCPCTHVIVSRAASTASHAHTHARTHARTLARSLARTHPRPLTLTHARPPARSHARPFTRARAPAHLHVIPCGHCRIAIAKIHTRTSTHTHTHAHTHAHTGLRSTSRCRRWQTAFLPSISSRSRQAAG